MISSKRAFTMVELLVVVGMIALILGAITTSVSGAQQRARTQKAVSEVKVISQAILGYENYDQGGKFELPDLNRVDADASSLGFLLGKGGSSKSGEIPVLLMASLQNGKKMVDPWGTPYKITIKQGSSTLRFTTASGNVQTGYFLPNFYRLGEGERIK